MRASCAHPPPPALSYQPSERPVARAQGVPRLRQLLSIWCICYCLFLKTSPTYYITVKDSLAWPEVQVICVLPQFPLRPPPNRSRPPALQTCRLGHSCDHPRFVLHPPIPAPVWTQGHFRVGLSPSLGSVLPSSKPKPPSQAVLPPPLDKTDFSLHLSWV